MLLAGCNKVSHITKAGESANLTDWGMVELAANTPKHLSLGEGKDCTLTATVLASGNLQIVIKSEDKPADGQTPPGVPVGTPVELTQTMVVPSGVEMAGYVGHKLVRFTPKLKAE